MGTVIGVISAMIREEYTGRRAVGGDVKCVHFAKLPIARRKLAFQAEQLRARQGFFSLRK